MSNNNDIENAKKTMQKYQKCIFWGFRCFLLFLVFFPKIYQNMGQKLGSNRGNEKHRKKTAYRSRGEKKKNHRLPPQPSIATIVPPVLPSQFPSYASSPVALHCSTSE
jgi:hypothetical protein